MFEKGAEEHCNKVICSRCGIPDEGEATCHAKCHDWQDEYNAFQKGAEFGYNKANEWHYVKDGDLPKDEDDVLCQIAKDEFEVGYYHKKNEVFYTTGGEFIKVIAWKEIVLPEEVEDVHNR